MSHHASAFARHQQSRWLRPDAARWLRPDATKFLKPGTRLDDVYPALMPRRDALQRKRDGEIAEAIAHERSVLAALRAQLDAVIAELARRKTERKYNQNQPRVPSGNSDGGQWTSGSGGSGRPRVYIITSNPDSDAIGDGGLGINVGNVIGDVVGEVAREVDKLDLFYIKPRKPRRSGVRLAGDPPPLRRIHPDTTYETDRVAKGSLDFWSRKPTPDIVESLRPGQQDSLKVKPDGRIFDGNTRVRVLEDRGYNFNSLPRELPTRSGGRSGGRILPWQ